MHVAMIGTGYVGLVSGACFSEFGHHITCVDTNPARIEMLLKGEIPIYEPGLDDLVARNVKAGRLKFTTDLAQALKGVEAVFIAVGTPSRRGDGEADLTYVYAAAKQIAEGLKDYALVVTKSTVPVGTGREVARILKETRPELGLEVASNPEFLREGSAIEDFMRPDRVVCGAETERAQDVLRRLYRPLSLNETPILMTQIETAELIKYAGNAFLAMKISYINEMADLCEKIGISVQDVARGIGLDGRIGGKFLHAGPGYGGSCFPKDTRAAVAMARRYGSRLGLIEYTNDFNETRKKRMADKVIAACGGSVKGKTIAVLGLTFKPNTDDMRESPSLDIVQALREGGATVRAYDPEGMKEAAPLLPGITLCASADETLPGADALVIITEWNQFRALDLAEVKAKMKHPVMIDLRNIYKPAEIRAAGFAYHSVGRPPIGPA